MDYNKLICQYGEVVIGKVPVAESKLSRKWFKGIWLGKLERDDSNIIGTSAGAIAVRSVRRLPKESQIDAAILEEMRGVSHDDHEMAIGRHGARHPKSRLFPRRCWHIRRQRTRVTPPCLSRQRTEPGPTKRHSSLRQQLRSKS